MTLERMVECVRCKTQLAASAADFSADGMLCKQCAIKADVAQKLGVASFTGDTEQAAEYAFAKSRAWKHMIIGIIGVIGGGAMCAMSGALLIGAGAMSGRFVVIAGVILVGGFVEIGHAIARFSALNKPKT